MKKRLLAAAMAAAVAVTTFVAPVSVSAKSHPDGQVVGTTLFYITNSSGERILVSQIPVETFEDDMKSGKIDQTVHNYSLLDRYVTTVHQEAQGFTIGEYIEYAQSKSTDSDIKALNLKFEGKDKIAFWEMDDTAYEDMDSYTYDDLYGTTRYNYPLLYKYWNYKTQDYYDPDGKLSRDEVINLIWENRQPETFILSVRAYSQRYMATDEKYGESDYDMENYWYTKGYLDNQRTLRAMVGMTESDLKDMKTRASDTRYWIQSVMLDMEKDPTVKSKGEVAAPTAVMTEDDNYYYIKFSCATDGATVYYNHNTLNPSYMPTMEYDGDPVKIEKSAFPDGVVTMNVHAVKDGYTDKGVVTLKLTSSGKGVPASDKKTDTTKTWSDTPSGAWYTDAVSYVTENGLFDSLGKATGGADNNLFGPSQPMTRQMLVTALYRMAGSPSVSGTLPFTDVSASASYRDAVLWANQNGIVNGVSATSFNPDGNIKRQQIATMFMRYASYVKADTSATASLTAYKDASQVMDYALDGMKWCVGSKLIEGTSSDTLSPNGTATRAQVATMVQRFAAYVK